MTTDYSKFSTLSEFLHHTQGLELQPFLETAFHEIEGLRAVCEASQRVRDRNMRLIHYSCELQELIFYIRNGEHQSPVYSTYPEYEQLRQICKDKRSEFLRMETSGNQNSQ